MSRFCQKTARKLGEGRAMSGAGYFACSGENTRNVVFPLGGIGAGCIGLGLGIDPVQFYGFDQDASDEGGFPIGSRSDEQVGLATQGDDTHCAFGGVVGE